MYAIYLSQIYHQLPPSNKSQISSNASASQIHVLFFYFYKLYLQYTHECGVIHWAWQPANAHPLPT